MKISQTHHLTRRGQIKKNPTRHFKSYEAYRRWLAYGHIHGDFKKTPGHQRVFIRGKERKVKH